MPATPIYVYADNVSSHQFTIIECAHNSREKKSRVKYKMPVLVFDKKSSHDIVEGVSFGGLLLVLLVAGSVVVITVLVACCTCKDKLKKEYLHKFLGLIYPSFTQRSILLHAPTVQQEDRQTEANEILLYSERSKINKSNKYISTQKN